MIISESKKFIFIKSRKTAGSSIQIELSKVACDKHDIVTGSVWDFGTEKSDESYGAGRNAHWFQPTHPHPPIKAIKKWVTDAYWDDYFKFTVVRNPFDLTVSRYHWDRKFKEGKKVTSVEDFRDWVKTGNLRNYDRLWQYAGIGDRLEVDFVIRYENLKADFDKVCGLIGIERTELGNHKSGYRNSEDNYREFYDEESKLIVQDFFSEDLQKFGYTF